MTGILTGTIGGMAVSAGAQFIQSIFVRPRSIGGFTADVTLQEDHSDVFAITRHPVAKGATITDHAYAEPATVMIQVGWSNSSLMSLFDPNYVQTIYGKFLSLQSSLVPFSIVTGKRSYQNMLIRNLRCRTDHNTENVLIMNVDCQQLILANSTTVQLPTSGMKSPVITSGVQNAGTAQLNSSNNYNYSKSP